MGQSAACALFVPLLVLLTSVGFVSVLAQQSPPLMGQGVDPIAAGVSLATEDAVTPVYMSIELTKLLTIDEQDYTFDALLNVQQSWTDPRAKATWAIIEERERLFKGLNKTTQADDVQSCYASKNVSSAPCQSALASAPSCTKYCNTYGTTTDNPSKCCDLVWLPAMQVSPAVHRS